MRNQYLALFPFVRKYISLVNVFFFNAISRAQKKKEKVKHHTKAFFSFVSKVLVIFFFLFYAEHTREYCVRAITYWLEFAILGTIQLEFYLRVL